MCEERFICIQNCPFNNTRRGIDELVASPDGGIIGSVLTSKLMYCPVGNAPQNPAVIICGKTPSLATQKKFINLCKRGESISSSAFKTVYSNMRKNLYRGLFKIGLFDYLGATMPFWSQDDPEILWERIFENEADSDSCGIQLTQACDCSILRKRPDGTYDSQQPNRSTLNGLCKINSNCLFSSFIVSDALKLVIFLDTPSNNRSFHQEHFFPKTLVGRLCAEQDIKVISIPHPSGANPIYNNLEKLTNPNAQRLFKDAAETVAYLKRITDRI